MVARADAQSGVQSQIPWALSYLAEESADKSPEKKKNAMADGWYLKMKADERGAECLRKPSFASFAALVGDLEVGALEDFAQNIEASGKSPGTANSLYCEAVEITYIARQNLAAEFIEKIEDESERRKVLMLHYAFTLLELQNHELKNSNRLKNFSIAKTRTKCLGELEAFGEEDPKTLERIFGWTSKVLEERKKLGSYFRNEAFSEAREWNATRSGIRAEIIAGHAMSLLTEKMGLNIRKAKPSEDAEALGDFFAESNGDTILAIEVKTEPNIVEPAVLLIVLGADGTNLEYRGDDKLQRSPSPKVVDLARNRGIPTLSLRIPNTWTAIPLPDRENSQVMDKYAEEINRKVLKLDLFGETAEKV